jgi:hypothetical protein
LPRLPFYHDEFDRYLNLIALWAIPIGAISRVLWFDASARSVSHLLRALEGFKAIGIEFVSLDEQIDTSTPTGKMILPF